MRGGRLSGEDDGSYSVSVKECDSITYLATATALSQRRGQAGRMVFEKAWFPFTISRRPLCD